MAHPDPGRRAPCAGDNHPGVLRGNPDPGRSASAAQDGNGSAYAAATGGNHRHGDDGRGINDGDNYHNHKNQDKNQEVNITNIDQGFPCNTGMPEEGMNPR